MNEVSELLIQGLTYAEIIKRTGKCKSTISYWSKKLKLNRKRGPRNPLNHGADGRFIKLTDFPVEAKMFPWHQINLEYQNGVTRKELKKKYGIYNHAWDDALKRGDIKKYVKQLTWDNLPSKLPHNRNSLKNILLKLGIPNECKICHQLPQWNNKPLSLQLDHIDGNTHNDVIDNLRLLCPNCHSQTDSFSGINIKKRKFEN